MPFDDFADVYVSDCGQRMVWIAALFEPHTAGRVDKLIADFARGKSILKSKLISRRMVKLGLLPHCVNSERYLEASVSHDRFCSEKNRKDRKLDRFVTQHQKMDKKVKHGGLW